MPTIADQGMPGFEAVLRYGAGRAGRHAAPGDRGLNKALNAALATDEVRKRLALEGAEPVPGTPEQYAADIDRRRRSGPRW